MYEMLSTVRILDGRFRIYVHHARLQLLGNLRKRIRELYRRGNTQGGRVRGLLPLFALHSIGDYRTNQNSNRQRRQYGKGIRPTIGFKAHPKGAFARIHCFLLKLTSHYTFAAAREQSEGRPTHLDAKNAVRVNLDGRRNGIIESLSHRDIESLKHRVNQSEIQWPKESKVQSLKALMIQSHNGPGPHHRTHNF